MTILLAAHRTALVLSEPFEQAAFVIHMNWVALKLYDILVIPKVLKAYRAHHGACLTLFLCKFSL